MLIDLQFILKENKNKYTTGLYNHHEIWIELVAKFLKSFSLMLPEPEDVFR